MKKLKRIINWTIWSLLALYVLLVVLVHIPAVQAWLGSMVAKAVGGKLGTEVSVGRVELGFFNRLIIDDVVINDEQHEPMLQARRMALKLDPWGLIANGRVNISSAQLFGAEGRFYRDSANAVPNYQFALDALSSNDEEKPSALNLHIGSLIVRRLGFSYDQKDAPQTPGKLNPKHLKVSDVSAHMLLRALTADTLSLNVKRLTLKEQSGLDLRQLSFKADANNNSAMLADLNVQLPHSTLTLDSLRAHFNADSLKETLACRTGMLRGSIDLADLKVLLPDEFPTNHTVDVECAFSGQRTTDNEGRTTDNRQRTTDNGQRTTDNGGRTTDNGRQTTDNGQRTTDDGRRTYFNVPHLNIRTSDGALALQATGRYDGEWTTGNGDWKVDIAHLHVDDQLIAEMKEAFPALPPVLTRLGGMSLSGQANGTDDGDIALQGKINAGIGSLSVNASSSPSPLAPRSFTAWNAHIDTDSLDLKRLTDNQELGLIAAHLDLDTRQDVISVKGDVPRLDLKGYTYNNITLDGTYAPDLVAGKLLVDDANLQADVEGSYGKNIRLTGYIGKIAPQALNLSDHWGEATFSAVVDADITSTALAEMQGTIDLDDFIMERGDSTLYHLDNLHIRSGNTDNGRYIRMGSDFGEALLSGRYHLNTLTNSIASLFPLVTHQEKASDDDFQLAMRLSDSGWMQDLLGLPLELNGPLTLDAQVNTPQKVLDIEALVPAFNLAGNDLRNAAIRLTSNGDSAQCHMTMTRHTAKGNQQNLKLDAQTHGDELFSTLSISTPQADHGTFNTITRFYTNDNGKPETHVRVLPSQFIMKNAIWELEPCDILFSDKRLMIDQFTLHHEDEHLIVDGLASTVPTDSLLIDLNGIDVAYLLDLVNFRSVKFGGRVTGQAYVCHAFDNPEAWADISVGDFLFQQARMGTLEAHAEWNADEGQIDLDAAIDDGADAQTYVDGFVSPRKKELDLGIRARGTSIGFIHSFTHSFIGNIEGHAFGDVRVFGPLKQIDLSGEATVDGLASIIPLGTVYHFIGDTVRLEPGSIIFHDFRVNDRDEHQATLNGTIRHTHLKNINYSLNAQAEGLLSYDFPRPETGSVVGGTVWADGTANIEGRPGDVAINCDVTPTPGSVFYYNAANPDAINRQQFITWVDKSLPQPLSVESYSSTQGNTNVQGNPSPPSQGGAGSGSDVRLNLRINATPSATLRLIMDQHSNDDIALNGGGVLRASFYNKGAFQLFGTYDVERGTYAMTIQNIIKKNFTFQPGSSIIFGGDPMQAALNLKALYTVNGVSLSDLGLGNSFTSNTIRVNCLMNILGTAGDPHVEFDLEMPTVNSEEEQMIRSIISSEQELNQQVVYLLGIGRFYTQSTNNASQTYGQTELAMQSLLSGTVSSQINQLLSQVIKNDDWNFGANISTGNEGWHNAEYEGLVSGRMLNNRLLINGQFGYRDNATQTTPSFIGDFDIQYLLTPKGNLALKAYNQTNDRYFTHSSLNTQGVGIIMKKDFNGLRDLFTNRRKNK